MKNWFKIRSATRLALSLAAITAVLVFSAQYLRIIPNSSEESLANRIKLCETFALQANANIKSNRTREFGELASAVVDRNPELLSMALKRSNGNYAFQTESHSEYWVSDTGNDQDQVFVYVDVNGRGWGALEICFKSIESEAFAELISLILFMSAGAGVMSWVVLSRTLRYLNPNKVVPQRVRSAFETLAGGLMLLDKGGTIVHANGKLASMVDISVDVLIGMNVSELVWSTDNEDGDFSWHRCLESETQVCGEVIQLERQGMVFTYSTNSAPIFGSNGNCRGSMVSFDDVTALENKKADLVRMVDVLKTSRDQVTKQNEKLQFLASRDPLTKCFNRRSFWKIFNRAWKDADANYLSILMVDIDHFKLINDTHGHSAGDDVLRDLGQLLLQSFNDECLVCRFGGEEFAVLLMNANIDEAFAMAGQLRNRLRGQEIGGLKVTASIGVSNRKFGAMDPQHLLDQADECLYAAKRGGRDRVVRFDLVSAEIEKPHDSPVAVLQTKEQGIEYATVTGLLTAMAFRSKHVVEHSMRVANLSVALGRQFLKSGQLYELEIGALLHDVGIVGLEVLPGGTRGNRRADDDSLRRDVVGAKIVKLSLGCESVAEIVRCQHHWYSDFNVAAGQESIKQAIPVGARIVAVCNAFDNLVNQNERSVAEAFQILEERHAEYDPDLVQMLAHAVERQPHLIENTSVFIGSAQSALKVGKYVELLYESLDSMDIDQLRDCVQSLQAHASAVEEMPIGDAVSELEQLLESEGMVSDKVLEVSQQVIDLCRTARDSFLVSEDLLKLS